MSREYDNIISLNQIRSKCPKITNALFSLFWIESTIFAMNIFQFNFNLLAMKQRLSQNMKLICKCIEQNCLELFLLLICDCDWTTDLPRPVLILIRKTLRLTTDIVWLIFCYDKSRCPWQSHWLTDLSYKLEEIHPSCKCHLVSTLSTVVFNFASTHFIWWERGYSEESIQD